jgi:hypothetical protein
MTINSLFGKIKSLKVKIIIVIILIVFQGIFITITIYTDSKKTYKELEKTKDQIISVLSVSMVSSLWNFDFSQAKTLFDVKLEERDFTVLQYFFYLSLQE